MGRRERNSSAKDDRHEGYLDPINEACGEQSSKELSATEQPDVQPRFGAERGDGRFDVGANDRDGWRLCGGMSPGDYVKAPAGRPGGSPRPVRQLARVAGEQERIAAGVQ